jgi:hypothetical protein
MSLQSPWEVRTFVIGVYKISHDAWLELQFGQQGKASILTDAWNIDKILPTALSADCTYVGESSSFLLFESGTSPDKSGDKKLVSALLNVLMSVWKHLLVRATIYMKQNLSCLITRIPRNFEH